MKSLMKTIVGVQSTALVLCCFVSTGKADLSYDFESSLPASFVINPLGPPSGTLSGDIDGGLFRLTDSQIHSGGPPLGAAAADGSQVFGNVRISATVNAAGDSDDSLGLVVRSQSLEVDGGPVYAAGISFSDGFLEVLKIVPPLGSFPSVFLRSNSPEQGNQPLLTDLDRSYFLEFTVIDDVLDARVFDQAGGTELLHVHYVDNEGFGGPALAPGFAGISAARFVGALDATFDNLTITAIPEPSSMLLVCLGLGAGAIVLRRRQ